jgi:hypothetical protein
VVVRVRGASHGVPRIDAAKYDAMRLALAAESPTAVACPSTVNDRQHTANFLNT